MRADLFSQFVSGFSAAFSKILPSLSRHGGQGLGLAITRAIILEHGGKIEVSSKEGEGTLFTIRLPLA